ncbi:MAG TPA: VWA domain-containing protein [Gammaproteobacteria bacterium]
MSRDKLPQTSSRTELDAFLAKVAATPARRDAGARGRLVFALDATASREPTWDRAAQLQAEMFAAAAGLGGLAVQLAWYRGYLEFSASTWVVDGAELLQQMTAVRCRAGQTQLQRVLEHVAAEHARQRVAALVFVGDCVEELPDALYGAAGRLGVLGVPAFMFLEGGDPLAERVFREVARLSGGACCRFDPGSAEQLRQLLAAVAVFAAGGRRALEDLGRREHGVVRQLVQQLE